MRGKPHCRHAWKQVGPAPDFRGVACVRWKCDYCGKEWELFADIEPKGAVGSPGPG